MVPHGASVGAKGLQEVKHKEIHRCGACNGCGDCCILLNQYKGRFERCIFYNLNDPIRHCTNYEGRPDVCIDFPRGPFDVQYKENCGFYFLDDKGNKIDGYMNPSTRIRVYNGIKNTSQSQKVIKEKGRKMK